MSYWIDLAYRLLAFGLSAVGLGFCVGQVGELSMAQAASVGVGAYAYAVLAVGYALPGWAALAGAALTAAVFAWPPGLIGRNLAGDGFVVGTLAWNVVIAGLLANWNDGLGRLGSWRNLTNGQLGIAEVPPVLSRAVDARWPWLGVALVGCVVAGLLGLSHRVLASPWGRLLRAIRDAPRLALSLGKPVLAERALAAAAASFLGSMAGALWAGHLGFVDAAGVAGPDLSILFLACVLLGGAATVWGPLLGSAVVVLLPEALRYYQVDSARIASCRVIGYAAVLLLVLHLRPQGVLRQGGSGGKSSAGR